jgi:drug/metabolite transporter (DMT)-like permease
MIRIKLFLTAVLWGGTFIAGRIVAQNMNPFEGAFLRFFIASIFLVFIVWRREGGFPKVDFPQFISLAFLGMTGIFTYNIFFFSGLHHINAGRAASIIASNPIFISLFSVYFFKEKLTLAKIAGILLSVTGALIVISRGNLRSVFSGGIGMGELYIFLCVASWVSYSLLGKKVMVRLSPLASVSYSTLLGTIALSVPAIYKGLFLHIQAFSLSSWSSLFYLGFFGTVLGFIWYYQGINHIGPMKASIFINFVPISAIVLAYIILGENVSISLLGGTLLVISGVILTNFSRFYKIRYAMHFAWNLLKK